MSQHVTVINTPRSGERKFTIDGCDFTIDYDDATKLHTFLTLRQKTIDAMRDIDPDTVSPEDSARVFGEVAEIAREAIESILGAGSYARLFGDERPVIRSMVLVTALANELGPVYDALFSEYTVKQ